MKFFLNQLQIKLVSLTIVIALITFIACKRTTDVQNTNDNFAVKEAKDWYYGYFKKSIYFKNLNTNSPFVSNFEQNVASKSNNIANGNLKKSPKWSLAQSVTINGVQIVEVPILYDVTTVMLPGTQNKTQSIKKQMANASLSKILFIKQANGSVAIRLVTIVPTVEYAAIKNYDISSNSAVNLDEYFSGYIMVRKWDETPIKTLKILDGSSFRNVTMRKRVNNTGSKVQTESGVTPCYWVWVPQIFRTCAIAYQGDEPDHECEEWNEAESPTEGSWELNEDCGDSGDFEDEDLCLMFGIGCDEDEEDPCIMYGNCEDQVDCSMHEEEALNSLHTKFENHVKDIVDENVMEITSPIDPIYEEIKSWEVVKGQINSWRINAKTKVKLTKDNPLVNNNKTLELTYIESKFEGYNSIITTTWENPGHSEQINNNHTHTPIGRAIVWGTVHHEMRGEVKIEFKGCEFNLHPGLELFKDVRNELRVF